MKKTNYAYLTLGFFLSVLWVMDILSFFKIEEMWEMVRGIYGIAGPLLVIATIIEGLPTTENKDTQKRCDLCGEKIKKDEKSIHYPPKDGNSIDYCEKCKDKIK